MVEVYNKSVKPLIFGNSWILQNRATMVESSRSEVEADNGESDFKRESLSETMLIVLK